MAADDAAGLAQRLRRVFNKDVLSAVQLLHQETRCFVCCDYFCNPHQCQNGHTFCKQCLDHAMQVTATCRSAAIPSRGEISSRTESLTPSRWRRGRC
ncbi:hypothetical protein FNF28_04233 [Cafeteria roenbergensis]|uniref:RING-type domain-containing protein n=1 Tax=Cafeteria roenbergensis TaxID=33653 RepID=A0A5A8DFL6_CAFRO|nr:hypothetical protein FNF28_04233 [Cafeteria roenbergensis]